MTNTTFTTRKALVEEINSIVADTGISAKAVAERANIKLNSKTTKGDLEIVVAHLTTIHDNRVELVNDIKRKGGQADIKMKIKDLKAIYKDVVEKEAEKVKQQKEAEKANQETPVTNESVVAETPKQEEKKMPKKPALSTKVAAQEQIIQELEGKVNGLYGLVEAVSGQLTDLHVSVIKQNEAPVAPPAVDTQTLANLITPPVEEAPVVERTKEQKLADAVEYINTHFGAPVADITMPRETLVVLYKKAYRLDPEAQKKASVQEASPTPALSAALAEGTVIYTDEQMATLEKYKDNPSAYRIMKDGFDKTNTALGRTVGGKLSEFAHYFDHAGHKAVDNTADFIDVAIDAVKDFSHKAIDLGATGLHSVNSVGRAAGHAVVNGVVYTVDGAGNIINKN